MFFNPEELEWLEKNRELVETNGDLLDLSGQAEDGLGKTFGLKLIVGLSYLRSGTKDFEIVFQPRETGVLVRFYCKRWPKEEIYIPLSSKVIMGGRSEDYLKSKFSDYFSDRLGLDFTGKQIIVNIVENCKTGGGI